MAVDLMQLIKGSVTPQAMSQLGGALGIDPKTASTAFEMGSAAFLGGVINKASTAEGAKAIFDMVKKADISVLDKWGDLMGGTAGLTDTSQKSGSDILDLVLGGNKSGMIEALAKAVGIDSSVIKKLLAMIAPIVIGWLGKQIQTPGLDLSGMGDLLNSQKNSLAGFLPTDLKNDLGFGNLLGDFGKSATAAATTTIGTARQTGSTDHPPTGVGLGKILIPLLLVALLGVALWKYVLNRPTKAVDLITSSTQTNLTDGPIPQMASSARSGPGRRADSRRGALPTIDFDLSTLGDKGATLKTGFTDITNGLAKLADASATEETANQLLDKISGFTGKIDGLDLDKLEGLAKTASSLAIGAFLKSIDGLMEKVPAPWRGMVEPQIKNLKEKLDSFK